MGRLPLEGVKVADFTWVGVGPLTVKYLADHGATVVHVESLTHPDPLRLAPPFKGGAPGINRSGFFANYNASKYGVTLNLANPKGQEAARRLIAWADVVAESFTPGVMARFGLDYGSVRQWKPDVIYYSTCQLGQDGPWAHQPGYGVQLSAFSGFYHLARWPDRPPAGPYGAYTDFINPRLGAMAILAALEYRRRTGKGQHIDLSQMEGGIQFLGPLLMDYLNNGREAQPLGNRDPLACPHGAFPAQGEDRWVVIACFTDAHWQGLVQAMGNPPWALDPKFATFLGRKAHEDEVEEHIARWTREHDPFALMHRLQSHGVPCGVVQSQEDLYRDPQLSHRGHFVPLNHTEIGVHHYDGIPFALSRTPGRLTKAAPCLGEDTERVFTGLLGMGLEEYEAYKAAGAFG
jgi:benzylsuccinate CoA-transferase BbsF subunit